MDMIQRRDFLQSASANDPDASVLYNPKGGRLHGSKHYQTRVQDSCAIIEALVVQKIRNKRRIVVACPAEALAASYCRG